MSAIVLAPKRAAETVAHEEQLRIWAHEIVVRIGMAGYLRELSGPEVDDLHSEVEHELKDIIESAFDHPEARTIVVKL